MYVMNADGSEQKRVTNSIGDELFPSWSSNGKKIAFMLFKRDGIVEEKTSY